MYAFNPDTGKYEPVDFSDFLAELKRRSEVIRSTANVEEAFAAGGDFQDMAEAHRRKCDGKDRNDSFKANEEDYSWQKMKREQGLEDLRK